MAENEAGQDPKLGYDNHDRFLTEAQKAQVEKYRRDNPQRGPGGGGGRRGAVRARLRPLRPVAVSSRGRPAGSLS